MDAYDTQVWAVAVVILVALVAAAWLLAREHRRKQSHRLQQRFGPEYARVVAERGNKAQAEAELLERERRVERFKLLALTAEDAAKFGHAWATLQTRFVDNPRGAVVEADHLVRDLMVRRGYPMADFERRAADISVAHPVAVDAYRNARAIAVRDQTTPVSTEELREAMVYYRKLFDELLETHRQRPTSVSHTETVHT